MCDTTSEFSYERDRREHENEIYNTIQCDHNAMKKGTAFNGEIKDTRLNCRMIRKNIYVHTLTVSLYISIGYIYYIQSDVQR